MPEPAAVVFDLDYTLAVTARERQALLDEAAATADVPPIDREAYLEAHGRVEAEETRAPIFEQLLPPSSAAAGDVAAAYRDAIGDALEPVPGAERLVREIREHARVGLLTDGPRVAQRGKLQGLGWLDLFDAVVITGELPAAKPDERAFRAICADLDVDPTEAVYVGDRPEVDVAGAAAVGFRTVQVLFSDGPPPHAEADATVERAAIAEQLPAVLDSL